MKRPQTKERPLHRMRILGISNQQQPQFMFKNQHHRDSYESLKLQKQTHTRKSSSAHPSKRNSTVDKDMVGLQFRRAFQAYIPQSVSKHIEKHIRNIYGQS